MVDSDFKFVTRHRALTQPHYWFDIDEYRRGADQMLLAHLRFSKFSPTILRNALHDWALFREHVSAPVFAFGEVEDAKFERFVSLFGFKPLGTNITIQGESRKLFLQAKGLG